MPKFFIQHITQYQYQQYAQYSANRILLYPLQDAFQEVLFHELKVTANPQISLHKDYYGNDVGTFTLVEPHLTLTIDSSLEVQTHRRPDPIDHLAALEQWSQLLNADMAFRFNEFLQTDLFGSRADVRELFQQQMDTTRTPLEMTKRFTKFIYEEFAYVKGITTVDSTLEEIWQHKSGVCQDFAHMLLAFLRMAGIPARYVSGYICPHQNGMRGEGATHAWVEVYIPENGWIGVDPTNNCIVNDTHVRLAVGRHFNDCSPVKGTYRGGAEHHLHVGVTVSYEDGLNMQGEADVDFVSDRQREQQFAQSQQ
ncbi:MAG: transglutaminase family protein [Bacteroidetes bacterium]|nr:transglutaminase family protein [Bacteroidota bacterium]